MPDGEFHEALTCAAGEPTSYMFTGNEVYRSETAEALQRADAAADMLRLIVGEAPLAVGDHVRFLERQEKLLRATEAKIRHATALSSVAGTEAASDALRQIRALDGERAEIPVVALTAYRLTGQKQRYVDAGFDDLLAKPYTVEEIEEVLHHWLVVDRSDGVAPTDSTAGNSRP